MMDSHGEREGAVQNSGETGRERGRGRNRYVPCKTYIIFKMTPVMSRTLGLWMEASPVSSDEDARVPWWGS